VFFVLTLCCVQSKATDDTLFVDDVKDIRYLNYKDSLEAYNIGYSVAKNISDTLKSMYGYKDLDKYFLNRYAPETYTNDGGYIFEYVENPSVDVGHLNVPYKRMKNDASFPWAFLEAQYKRLNVIKIQPVGLMEGAELPDVYVYAKPQTPVIFKIVKRFTVVGQIIKFRISDGGKTKTPYIEKVYYIEDARKHQIIDSIEKLDPVFHKHLDF
jgi:hypothetical protein